MYIYVYSNWKYSWKQLVRDTHKNYIFYKCMKSLIHFVQTYVYQIIWSTYERKSFRTMGAWLETSTKYFLVTFLNVVIRNDEYLFSKLPYIVKRKGYLKK